MSYQYHKHEHSELEEIADQILSRCPSRRRGVTVDIEGIVEDFHITILPRRGGLHTLNVHGYVPKDPHYIVTAEAMTSFAPRYRPIVAEELCHRILEFKLWNGKALPDGAHGHELTAQQHRDIEADADYLACAILFPRSDFIARFGHHFRELIEAGTARDKAIQSCVKSLSNEFQVWEIFTARRARYLKLITHEEEKRNFSDRLQF